MPLELFRSEPMQYCRLTITNDAAQDTIRELGNMGKFHIVDVGQNSTQSATGHSVFQMVCALLT